VRTEFTQNWGATRSFTITDASRLTFLISPVHGATNQPTTLNLVCSQVPGATEFTFQIHLNGVSTGEVTSNSRTIRATGLRPDAFYDVRVKTNVSTTFGPIRSFTTGAAVSTLAAYPNPATGQVTIGNIRPGHQVNIIEALSGTLVETFRATSETLTVETTKYRKGLYYVNQVNADGSEGESLKLMVK
jgi:hypothetical protein